MTDKAKPLVKAQILDHADPYTKIEAHIRARPSDLNRGVRLSFGGEIYHITAKICDSPLILHIARTRATDDVESLIVEDWNARDRTIGNVRCEKLSNPLIKSY